MANYTGQRNDHYLPRGPRRISPEQYRRRIIAEYAQAEKIELVLNGQREELGLRFVNTLTIPYQLIRDGLHRHAVLECRRLGSDSKHLVVCEKWRNEVLALLDAETLYQIDAPGDLTYATAQEYLASAEASLARETSAAAIAAVRLAKQLASKAARQELKTRTSACLNCGAVIAHGQIACGRIACAQMITEIVQAWRQAQTAERAA